jgi:hypothetical protein
MIEIFDCDQNSEAWYLARKGLPTASEFAAILSPGKGKAESKTRRTYLLKLAGEILTGDLMEHPTSFHMERGKVMEDEARDAYAFHTDAEPIRVGFVRNGQKGCSPDSLVGDVGMLEIKTKLPHLIIDLLIKDEFPEEHIAQCQGALWVCEREWIDIAVYWPKLPTFIKRAYRDEPFIAKLSDAVDAFNAELAATVDQIRRYGALEQAA